MDDSRHHFNSYPRVLRGWSPDLARDPVHRILDRFNFVFPILLAIALYAIGGMSWLVWGGFVRTVLVLHTTWLVNSATHVWGYRSHDTTDSSTNLWWVALLTYGEGWHNNHHAFQTSARHGLRWWEIDMTYMAIRAMSWVGITRNVKLPKVTRASYAPIGGAIDHPVAATKVKKRKKRRGEEDRELVGAAD